MEGDSPSTGLFEEPLLEARDAGLPSDFPELPPCAPAQVNLGPGQWNAAHRLPAGLGRPGHWPVPATQGRSVPRLAQPFAAWPHVGGCTLVTGRGTAGCGRYIRRKTCRKHRKVCLLSEMGDKRLKAAPSPWCLCREVLFPLNRPQQERLWERQQVQTLIKHLLPIIFPQFHLFLTLAPLQSCFLREMVAAWTWNRGTAERDCVAKEVSQLVMLGPKLVWLYCWGGGQCPKICPVVQASPSEVWPQKSCSPDPNGPISPARKEPLHFNWLSSPVWAVLSNNQCLHGFLCINSIFLMRLETPLQ